MLPKEYLNVSQCPNFILEDPGRIAGYLAAYEKNKAALFETTDKMTIIGENFKKRLRAQIGRREIAARIENPRKFIPGIFI